MQLGGHEIIQNHQLCEEWEIPNWKDFEIVTGLKDLEQIKQLGKSNGNYRKMGKSSQ